MTLTGQAKGAGMISPGFATLLVFVQTDAKLSPRASDLLLGVCVKRSFERVSVDGRLSTNDTVILQCSGASGVAIEPETEDELHFGEALDALMRQLALLVVGDGEGARRVGRVVVRGGETSRVHPGRPRRGQLPAGQDRAVRRRPQLGPDHPGGRCRPCPARRRCPSRSRSRACRCAPGAATWLTTRRPSSQAVARGEVEYEIGLPGEGAETEVFFSDLGHEYVTINADYTT